MTQASQKSFKKTQFQTKLLKYSTAAGAALTLSHSADAVIVPVDVTGLSITLTGDNDSQEFSFDLNGDNINDFEIAGFRTYTFSLTTTPGGDGYTSTSIFGGFRLARKSALNAVINLSGRNLLNMNSGSGVKALDPGENQGIGSFGNFFQTSYSSLTGSNNFAPTSGGSFTGITGLAFDISGSRHYAWLEVLVSRDSNGRPSELTVLSGAYEDQADVDIAAGAIPEPASVSLGLGLLALGAAGVRSMRRQSRV